LAPEETPVFADAAANCYIKKSWVSCATTITQIKTSARGGYLYGCRQLSATSIASGGAERLASASTVTDRASGAWEGVSKRGADYDRQGSRAVSNADSATASSLLIAGAIGFGIGWLVFGQKSYSSDYVARRMSDSSNRRYELDGCTRGGGSFWPTSFGPGGGPPGAQEHFPEKAVRAVSP
jgi:hypothetical protein